MHRKIISHTGNLPEGFTGIVYNDTGKNNYAAMVNGQWLKRKDHMVRWFGSDMAAARAIDAIDGGKTTWTTRV
jgi:hypothetical protein